MTQETSPQTKPLIFSKMIAVMQDIGAIGKDAKNTQQGYSYRKADDVIDQLHAICAKHGVIIAPKLLSKDSEERTSRSGTAMIYRVVVMQYRFYAEDGSYMDVEMPGEGSDSGDKAAGKACTYALKQALSQTFLIPFKEVTIDSEAGDSQTGEDPEFKGEPKKVTHPSKKGVYSGTPDQAKIISDILVRENFPMDKWDEVHKRLMGRPSSDLKQILKELEA